MAKKYTSSYSGERIDRSVAMIPENNPEEESILVISKAGKGSYKKVSEVGATVVQETGDSETQVMSQKAVTNALGTKADKQNVEGMISDLVVQETGKATDKVMSQDATTKELNKKLSTSNIGQGLSFSDNKINANIAKIQDSTSNEFAPDENGVVTIPSGSANNLGLMRLVTGNGYHGLQMFGAGAIAINPAGKSHIDTRIASIIGSGNLSPIISSDINYAVKAALTDDKRIGTETTGTNTAFTDTEKDRACEILGASRKLYRHYTTFDDLGYGSCKLSFISLKPDVYSSAENLSELKDAVSVEYCTIGDSSYLIGTLYINPNDGDYTLRTAEHSIVIYTVTSFTDTVTEL